MARLFRLLQLLTLAQSHAPAAAILVDELNSRFFESSSDFICCIGSARDLPIDRL